MSTAYLNLISQTAGKSKEHFLEMYCYCLTVNIFEDIDIRWSPSRRLTGMQGDNRHLYEHTGGQYVGNAITL